MGFKPLRHEGKITGLAAFGGDSALRRKLEALFTVAQDGRITRISSKALESQVGPLRLDARERKLINAAPAEYHEHTRFGIVLRHWLATHAEGMQREDVAFAVQAATENLIVASVGGYARTSGATLPVPVGLAGGLFANVKLNQRIRDEIPEIADVFIQPAMGDCGLSVGAALLAAQEDGSLERKPLRHLYYDSAFSDNQIEEVLALWPSKPVYRLSNDIEAEIGEMLAAKKVVGRFSGGIEFGPLGAWQPFDSHPPWRRRGKQVDEFSACAEPNSCPSRPGDS